MKFHLFLLILHFASTAPVNKLGQESSFTSSMESCPQEKCYFSLHHKVNWETEPRPEKSKVSTECANELLSFGELLVYPIDAETGETNALSLLICRGTGECDLDFNDQKVVDKWKNYAICERHVEELLTKWGDSNSFRNHHVYRINKNSGMDMVCSMPEELGPHHKKTRPGPDHLRVLKIEEADAIIKQEGVFVHPGIPICQRHEKFVAGVIKQHMSQSRKRTRISGSYVVGGEEEASCSNDRSFYGRSTTKRKRSHAGYALKQFSEFVGVDRVCFPNKKFTDLEERSQHKKTCALKKMFDSMVEVVGDGDVEALKKKVITKFGEDESWSTGSTENFENVMNEVASQYLTAEDKMYKKNVLSVVANSIPYHTVEKYIPNLSRYMYNSAKVFARRSGNRNLKAPEKVLERYKRESLEFFIDFITSSSVMIGLPYGVKKVQLADGSKYEIPNTIRQQSSTEIYEMYIKLLKNSNQMELELSRSSVFRILDICSATKRKATACVDYFTANGMEGFDTLHEILDGWMDEGLAHLDTLKQLKNELFEAAQYLRTDYRLHVKHCSRVSDHCSTLALSDPNDQRLSSTCSNSTYEHKYDMRCDRCERANATLFEMKNYALDFVAEALEKVGDESQKRAWEQRKEEQGLIEKSIVDIFEMKKHYLRARYTSLERDEIISNLRDNEALITMDFAQKFLPRWHREKQNDYFGKKGISYHIAHVTANIDGIFTQHSFVHIYDSEVSQDSKLVVLTLDHIMSELKKVGIVQVSLRSDNAGSYHCAATINAMHWLVENTGVRISTYTFSEAQNGKSSSDRDASRVKRKAEDYVSKGKDITTPEQFFTALSEGRLLNGMSLHYGSVTVEDEGDAKWPGISTLNHFTFEETGIRGRRYGKIGDGYIVLKSELKPMKGESNFKDAGFLSSRIGSIEMERQRLKMGEKTIFWYYSECQRKRNGETNEDSSVCITEKDEITMNIDDLAPINEAVESEKLYECPELGCSSSFLSHWNLEKHLLRGKHSISPQKMTLRDAALQLFVRNLEEVQHTSSCSIINDALDGLTETSDNQALEAGWALPKKQTRKPFEPHVKTFLIACFEEGLTKKRLDPRTVEKRMRTEKKSDGSFMFSVEERKDFRQIAAFFSREAEKRRKAHKNSHRHRRGHRHRHFRHRRNDHVRHRYGRRRRNDHVQIDENSNEINEEHDDAGWIAFLKDESFWTDGDELFNALLDPGDPIFLNQPSFQ